jgi:hypothetical protein
MANETIPENPPAFPESVAVDHMDGLNFSRNKGMTLRDYFAAAALQGIIAADTNADIDANAAARYAYDHADAMLRDRAARTGR